MKIILSFYFKPGFLIGLSLLLVPVTSCVGSRGKEPFNHYLKEAPDIGPQPEAKSSPVFKSALEFDQWLKGHLTAESSKSLKESCQKDSKYSPFCSSILSYDQLEERRKNSLPPKRRNSSRALLPKIQKGQVTNWVDLRFSPVVPTLRGLGRVRPLDLETLQKLALAESSCPNNIAIALAAHLEDRLPHQISFAPIGELYEKGGKCPSENPGDSETLLTRAGLMFFAANQLEKAESCFQLGVDDKDAFRSRALYWLGRTHQEKGNSSKSKAVFQELKKQYPFSFHTLMAFHSQKEDPGTVLKQKSPSPLSRSEQSPQINNLVEQVEILNQFGFQQAADKLIGWIVSEAQKVEPEFMIYVSDLRHSQGNYLGQLQILTNILYSHPQLTSKAMMERYFPKHYFPIFEKHSQGLDPYLLISIARRESAFNPKAVSQARAKGLMQISPQTQRRLASKTNIFDPEANISMGSRYLSTLIRKSNGNIHLALAGYNAGPNRVDLWTARYPISDPVLFIDLIPFKETREYVASVLRNYYWYRRLHLEENPVPIESLLKP